MSYLKFSHSKNTIVISFCSTVSMSVIQIDRTESLLITGMDNKVFIKNKGHSESISIPQDFGVIKFIEETCNYIKKVNRIEKLINLAKVTLKVIIIGFALSSLLIFNDAIFRVSTALLPSAPNNIATKSAVPFIEDEAAKPEPLAPTLSSTKTTTLPNHFYTETEILNAKEIAASLLRGTSTGDYSVNLINNGPSAIPLYVFSDPNCEHCQAAGPLLEALAKMGMNVHIFPVSVIGQAFSTEKLIPLLCLRGDSRVAAWRSLLNRTTPLNPEPPTPECEAGKIALGNNNGFFAKYKFPGTPVFIRADGHQYPLDQPVDVYSLNSWAKEGK